MNKQLLELFLQHPERYISGEEISRLLHCSRTAVWKQIQNLKREGYEFEAVPRRGYRLICQPSRLNQAALLAKLRTKVMGRPVYILEKVASTQTVAHQLVSEGAGEGTLVIAEQQTAGRGRMGRTWYSPAGKGIWMSLVLFPQIPLHFTSQLTLLVAVAVCRAIRMFTGVQAGIKWPNDLLVRNKKVCGILLESSAEDQRLRYVVAGIGISVNLKSGDFPDPLRHTATSLMMESGGAIERHALICEILLQLEQLYELYHEQGFAPIRLLWESLNVSLGRPIQIRTPAGTVHGTAEAVDEYGALVLRLPDGNTRKFYSGDVEFT